MPTTLSFLSPEVIINILGSLPTEKDLRSAITSSKYLYEIFKTRRRSILLGILQSNIPAEIEDDFTLAWRAQCIWDVVPELNDTIPKTERNNRIQAATDRLRRETDGILNISQSSNGSIFQELKSGQIDFEELMAFYRKFNHFVLSFTAKILSALQQSPGVSQTPVTEAASTWSTLSFAETTRIKRAFFRFEVLSCLSQLSQMNYRGILYHDKLALAEPARTYMKSLQPWELEELACVGQFYSTLVEATCEKLEHDFVKTVKEKEKTYIPPTDDEKKKRVSEWLLRPPRIYGHVSDIETWLRRYRLCWYDSYHKDTGREAQIDYIISRGISAVWKITQSSLKTARRMIVLSHFTSRERTSVMTLFKNIHSTAGEEENYQTDPGASPGWLWAREPMYSWQANAPANHNLRAEGYVFWDRTRLNRFERFQSPREPRKVKNALYVTWDPAKLIREGIRPSLSALTCGINPGEYPLGHIRRSDFSFVKREFAGVDVHNDVVREIAGEILGPFRPIPEKAYPNNDDYYSDDFYSDSEENEGEWDSEGEAWKPVMRPRYELKWRD